MSPPWASATVGSASITARNGRRMRFTTSNLARVMLFRTASLRLAHDQDYERAGCARSGRSREADAVAEGVVAHRGVLAQKVVAGRRAQIHQAAHRMLDRRELAARDAADHVDAGRTDLDLHLRVDGARRA